MTWTFFCQIFILETFSFKLFIKSLSLFITKCDKLLYGGEMSDFSIGGFEVWSWFTNVYFCTYIH